MNEFWYNIYPTVQYGTEHRRACPRNRSVETLAGVPKHWSNMSCHSISDLRQSYNYTCSLSLSFYSFLLCSSTYKIHVYCYFLFISISFLIMYSN